MRWEATRRSGNVVGSATDALQDLHMGWRYVDFYSVIEGEIFWAAVLIETFFRDGCHEGFVSHSHSTKSLGRETQSSSEIRR